MNEQKRQEILKQLEKKMKEYEKNEKKTSEYCTKIKIFSKNDFFNYLKKIKKEVQNLDIEEVTMTIRLLYK